MQASMQRTVELLQECRSRGGRRIQRRRRIRKLFWDQAVKQWFTILTF